VIFDLIHNWWEFPYHTEKQRKNINQNLSKSDLIITDSEITLGILKSKKIECKKLYLPPGVDAIWFERGENKYCNESRKKRSIAFFGNLRANSDTNLLDKIVENSSLDLEIYGLLDPSLGKENIIKFQKYYFGKLSVDKLVDKLNRVDMILLPYDESSFSKSIFPAKYFEALALGKPIISNSNLYHLPGWEKIVWRSTDLDVLGVEKLISIHTMERAKMQIEIAEKNSWTNRVTVLKDAINESI
jgi:glycosyltransferase involved in cell wall biosynthesis